MFWAARVVHCSRAVARGRFISYFNTSDMQSMCQKQQNKYKTPSGFRTQDACKDSLETHTVHTEFEKVTKKNTSNWSCWCWKISNAIIDAKCDRKEKTTWRLLIWRQKKSTKIYMQLVSMQHQTKTTPNSAEEKWKKSGLQKDTNMERNPNTTLEHKFIVLRGNNFEWSSKWLTE